MSKSRQAEAIGIRVPEDQLHFSKAASCMGQIVLRTCPDKTRKSLSTTRFENRKPEELESYLKRSDCL